MNNKILTFEWDDKHQKLEIHGNIEGIASLTWNSPPLEAGVM